MRVRGAPSARGAIPQRVDPAVRPSRSQHRRAALRPSALLKRLQRTARKETETFSAAVPTLGTVRHGSVQLGSPRLCPTATPGPGGSGAALEKDAARPAIVCRVAARCRGRGSPRSALGRRS